MLELAECYIDAHHVLCDVVASCHFPFELSSMPEHSEHEGWRGLGMNVTYIQFGLGWNPSGGPWGS